METVMRLKKLPVIFRSAMPVLKKLEAAGFQAYFVGGAVRDVLLKRHIHDIDIATSAYPQEVKETFTRTIDTGIQHGTVTVLFNQSSYEITTFRTESGYQDYRRPDHVTFVQNLNEDLKRRDFTINALAMKTDGEIIDLFGGLKDLQRHLIKAVGNPETRFHEDALRMMRAIRFMSQLDFHLAPETEKAIRDHHDLLAKISVERVRDELVKTGLGQAARQAFKLFLKTKLSEEVPTFKGKQSLLKKYEHLSHLPTNQIIFWAVIIILLELKGSLIGKFMHAWKTSNQMKKMVEKTVSTFTYLRHHSADNEFLFASGFEVLQQTLTVSYTLGQPLYDKKLIAKFKALPFKPGQRLAVDGHFFLENGIPAGPQIGKLIELAKKAVINGKVENNQKAIFHFLKDGGYLNVQKNGKVH